MRSGIGPAGLHSERSLCHKENGTGEGKHGIRIPGER